MGCDCKFSGTEITVLHRCVNDSTIEGGASPVFRKSLCHEFENEGVLHYVCSWGAQVKHDCIDNILGQIFHLSFKSSKRLVLLGLMHINMCNMCEVKAYIADCGV